MKGLYVSSIKLSEAEYAELFQSGAEKAYDFFFRKHYPALLYFANKILNDYEASKDILQDSFVKLWDKHPSLNRPEVIKSYLYRMVYNNCIDQIRQDKKESNVKADVKYLSSIVDDDNFINNVIEAETMSDIYFYIESLPSKMRQVFKLFYIEGKTHKEISLILGTAEATIRKQRRRALELLKLKLSPAVFVILTTQWINSAN